MPSLRLLLATALALWAGMPVAYKGPSRPKGNRNVTGPALSPCGDFPTEGPPVDEASYHGECFVLWAKFSTNNVTTIIDDVVMTHGHADPGNYHLAPAETDPHAPRAIFHLDKNGTGAIVNTQHGQIVLAYIAEPRFEGLIYTYLTPHIMNDKLLKVTPNLGKIGGWTLEEEMGQPLACATGIGAVLYAGDINAGEMAWSCSPAFITADKADCRTGRRLDPNAGPPPKPLNVRPSS